MTKKTQHYLMWAAPVLATLTALIGVEELREFKGIPEVLGLLLAILTAVLGYTAVIAKPEDGK